jgi:small GTP-binding protein
MLALTRRVQFGILMVSPMIHNTFLVYGRKVLASSQYWPTNVAPDEIDEFITTRADLLAEHGGSMDLPLIIGDKKFLARPVESDMLLIFVTDKGEDEHVVAERLDSAAKELAKKVRASGIRGIAKQYATLIEPMITTRLKIALVGEGGVGKTTTLQLLLGNSPPLSYVPTIALNLETVENIRFGSYSLVLWDFAGQERFRTLWKFYFHGADVIFLVCDSTLRNVIVSKDILKLIRRDAPKVPVFALANKQDKPNAMKPEVIQKILGIPTYPMVAIDMERRDEMLKILLTAAAQFVGVTLPDVPTSELFRFSEQTTKAAAKGKATARKEPQPEEAEEEVVEEVLLDEQGNVVESSEGYEVIDEVVEVVDDEEKNEAVAAPTAAEVTPLEQQQEEAPLQEEQEEPAETEPEIETESESAFEIAEGNVESSAEEEQPTDSIEAEEQPEEQFSSSEITSDSSDVAKQLIADALDADDIVTAEIDRVPSEHLGAALDAIRCDETVSTEPENESVNAVDNKARRDLDKVLGPSTSKESSASGGRKMSESPLAVGEDTIREIDHIIDSLKTEEKPSSTRAQLLYDDEDE